MTGDQDTHDILVSKLNKSFGSNHVLRDVDLRVHQGESFVLVGPSGCGKSVLLKHIIGLLRPDSGDVHVLGKNVHALPPRDLLDLRRRIGMVFQSSALLNSLTVQENVALGLTEQRKKDLDDINRIVNEKLALVRMENTNDLLPEELSGGMKKRVAVARTLALEPDVILFDEPTVGLDPLLSDNVDELILDLKKNVHTTNIVVTHDMISAFRLGDRIGMMHEGRIIAPGPPGEFRNSREKVVQEFIERNINWRF